MIAERLDFLMNVTNTKNSVLARALVVDQSYVSKARKGKRKLSRNQTFVNRAADYLPRIIKKVSFLEKCTLTVIGLMRKAR